MGRYPLRRRCSHVSLAFRRGISSWHLERNTRDRAGSSIELRAVLCEAWSGERVHVVEQDVRSRTLPGLAAYHRRRVRLQVRAEARGDLAQTQLKQLSDGHGREDLAHRIRTIPQPTQIPRRIVCFDAAASSVVARAQVRRIGLLYWNRCIQILSRSGPQDYPIVLLSSVNVCVCTIRHG